MGQHSTARPSTVMDPKAVEEGVQSPRMLQSPSTKEQVRPETGPDLDEAYFFLENIRGQHDDALDLKDIRRKVDWRIVSVMFLCYIMQFLDKVSLNVSMHFCFPETQVEAGDDLTKSFNSMRPLWG